MPVYQGMCVGGPMDGQTITARGDDGFIAVDRPATACWVYKADRANGRFLLCTAPDPSLIDEDGTRALDEDRVAGAPSKGLDVVVLPGDDDETPAEAPAIDGTSDPEGED
jgi:hypothetical protein